MIDIELVGTEQVKARFEALPLVVMQALANTVKSQARELANYVRTQKLQGQVLQHRKGALLRSIQSADSVSGTTVEGRVFSAGDVKYAAIHEYGGVIHHPGGTPYYIKDKGGLAVFISLKANAEKHGGLLPVTKPHDITMPQRSFLRSSLADNKEAIMQGIRDAALKAAREGAAG